jgi:proteasome lid subunit RPN8/RPN11
VSTPSDIVHIEPDVRRGLAAARERARPREACGVLLGTRARDLRTLVRAPESANVSSERDRFALDPGAIVAASALAERLGLELLGFWHSHAAASSRPSRADELATWPGHLLVVVADELGVWELDAARGWVELAHDTSRSVA